MCTPEAATDVTVDWLAEVLQSPDASRISRVESSVLQGGVVSQVVRLQLTYYGTAGSPETVIAKFGPNGPHFHEDFARREGHFYQALASKLTMPTPRCYHASVDSDARRTVLLIEDLTSCRSMTWESGIRLEDAGTALALLAEMHGQWWTSDWLDQADWLFRRDLTNWNNEFAARWEELSSQDRDALPKSVSELCGLLAAHGTGAFDRWHTAPQTLLHGDFHLHNTLFDQGSDQLRGVVDWSNVGVGPAAADLSFFVTHSFPPNVRRDQEKQIVESYHQSLCESGAAGYDGGTCWDDYRLWTLNFALLWATIPSQGRDHLPIWELLMVRLGGAVGDHQPRDLVEA